MMENQKFDRCQFDPKMGSRQAGTQLNRALPADFYRRRPGNTLYAAIIRILNRAAKDENTKA
jgi:hypothetical protein